jgi:hypothetical protein
MKARLISSLLAAALAVPLAVPPETAILYAQEVSKAKAFFAKDETIQLTNGKGAAELSESQRAALSKASSVTIHTTFTDTSGSAAALFSASNPKYAKYYTILYANSRNGTIGISNRNKDEYNIDASVQIPGADFSKEHTLSFVMTDGIGFSVYFDGKKVLEQETPGVKFLQGVAPLNYAAFGNAKIAKKLQYKQSGTQSSIRIYDYAQTESEILAYHKKEQSSDQKETVQKLVLEQTYNEAVRLLADTSATSNVLPVVLDYLRLRADEAKAVLDDENAIQERVNEAWFHLSRAIQLLSFKADKTELLKSIETAQEIDSSLYTEESFLKVTDELAKAQKIFDSTVALQEAIDQAKADLDAALSALEIRKNNANKEELETVVVKGQSLNNENDLLYVIPSAVEAFHNALSNAEALLAEDTDPTQEEVDAAVSALKQAIENLSLKGDKRELGALIEQAKAVPASGYTKESFAALQAVLAEAQAVSANPNALQPEIDTAVSDLKAALAALVALNNADKTLLQQAYDYALANATPKALEFVIAPAKKEIQNAIANAKAVLDAADPAQKEVNDAWKQLTEALKKLSWIADKRALNALIADCNHIDLSLYTPESVAAFQQALKLANEVSKSETALQKAVDSAVQKLTFAKFNLKEKRNDADRSKLEAEYEKAVSLDTPENLEFVIKSAVEEFKAAKEAANAVLNEDDPTQEQVDKAYDDLSTAIFKLSFKADKRALAALIAEVDAFDLSIYTPESIANLQQALASAKEINASESVLQDGIDEAYNALLAAKNALEIQRNNADKSKLQAEYDKVVSLDTEENLEFVVKYAVENFHKQKEAAKAVLDADDPTQEEVDTALANLQAAINMLDHKADKRELNALISEVDALDLDLYTPETVEKLIVALGAAQAVSASETALQDEINQALAALSAAKEELAVKRNDADKSLLEAEYEKAVDLDTKENLAYVLPSAVAEFQARKAEAKAILDADDPSQQEVDQAYDNLRTAILLLNQTQDKRALQNLISIAESLKPGQHSEDSLKLLEEAVKEAKAVVADENALQPAIDAAYLQLDALIKALQKLDYTILQLLVTTGLESDLDDFVNGPEKDVFIAELAAGQALIGNAKTQDEIQEQITRLNEAFYNLRNRPSQELIEQLTFFLGAADSLAIKAIDEETVAEILSLAALIETGLQANTIDIPAAELLVAKANALTLKVESDQNIEIPQIPQDVVEEIESGKKEEDKEETPEGPVLSDTPSEETEDKEESPETKPEAPADTPEEKPETPADTEEKPAESEEKPDEAPAEKPEDKPEEAPETKPEEKPEETPEAKPEEDKAPEGEAESEDKPSEEAPATEQTEGAAQTETAGTSNTNKNSGTKTDAANGKSTTSPKVKSLGVTSSKSSSVKTSASTAGSFYAAFAAAALGAIGILKRRKK